MQIRPIRTDADHAAALRRIDQLVDAEPGTAEAGELDVLATLQRPLSALSGQKPYIFSEKSLP